MGKDIIIDHPIQQGPFYATAPNKKYSILHRNSVEISRYGRTAANICAHKSGIKNIGLYADCYKCGTKLKLAYL